jgi:hypothetical protein
MSIPVSMFHTYMMNMVASDTLRALSLIDVKTMVDTIRLLDITA